MARATKSSRAADWSKDLAAAARELEARLLRLGDSLTAAERRTLASAAGSVPEWWRASVAKRPLFGHDLLAYWDDDPELSIEQKCELLRPAEPSASSPSFEWLRERGYFAFASLDEGSYIAIVRDAELRLRTTSIAIGSKSRSANAARSCSTMRSSGKRSRSPITWVDSRYAR